MISELQNLKSLLVEIFTQNQRTENHPTESENLQDQIKQLSNQLSNEINEKNEIKNSLNTLQNNHQILQKQYSQIDTELIQKKIFSVP